MGDFNLDFNKIKDLPAFLQYTYSLDQLITKATTNYQTTLDHIYTNIDKGS